MKTFFVVINNKPAFQLQAKNIFDGYVQLLSLGTKGKIQLIEKHYFLEWSKK